MFGSWLNRIAVKRLAMSGTEPVVQFTFLLSQLFHTGATVPDVYFDIVREELARIFPKRGASWRPPGGGLWQAGDPEGHIEFYAMLPRRWYDNYLLFFRVYQTVLRARFDQQVIFMHADGLPGRVVIHEYEIPLPDSD